MKPLCVPILGILVHVIVNWRSTSHKKNGNFCLENLLIRLNSKTTWRVKLKFGHNEGAYKCFMQTEIGAPGHVTKILQSENGQKVDEFGPTWQKFPPSH